MSMQVLCCNVALKVDALKTYLQKAAKDDPEVATFTNITKKGISSLTTHHCKIAFKESVYTVELAT